MAAMFFVVVLSIWTALNTYVGWRVATLPWVAAHLGGRTVAWGIVLLGVSYPALRVLSARGWRGALPALELVGSTWIGVLFLLFVALLAVDVVTLGGWLLPRFAPYARSAAAAAALVLAGIALVQGLRAPVVREHEVVLPGLPRERDGLSLVVVSDLHLGTLLGERWLAARVAQVAALRPDAVLIAGDLVDSDVDRALPLEPVLRQLQAPLGVWVALGNHDFYAGADRVAAFAERASLQVLRNRSVELVPGLTLAGIDDPVSLHGAPVRRDRRLEQVLAGTRPGATILLAHTPEATVAEAARQQGVGLMFSGHTHGGQLWPFGYLVRRRFALFAGRYDEGAFSAIVCRGTGTWGPRMRLWSPGEILHVRLRAAGAR